MPTIVAALGRFELFSWVFAVYLLTQAVTTPIYGRLADLYGRKWVLMSAAGAFLVGTILCSLARTMPELIGFRTLQGLGAGALTAVAYTIVGDIYPPADRARIQGYLNIIWGVAAVGGPVLGAFLTSFLGWPSVFWVNLPVGIFALAALAIFYREEPHAARHSIDWLGSLLLVAGFGSLMLALIQAEHLSLAVIVSLLAGAASALILLVLVERRVANPVLPLGVWGNRVTAAANVGALAIGAVMMTTPVFVPIYVQGLMGRSPLVAGFALTSQSIAWTFTGALSGWAAARRSYREISFWGGLCFVAGALFFVTLSPERGPVMGRRRRQPDRPRHGFLQHDLSRRGPGQRRSLGARHGDVGDHLHAHGGPDARHGDPRRHAQSRPVRRGRARRRRPADAAGAAPQRLRVRTGRPEPHGCRRARPCLPGDARLRRPRARTCRGAAGRPRHAIRAC